MALTFTRVPDGIGPGGLGHLNFRIVDITLDNSYATNGYTIQASDVGFKALYGAQEIGSNPTGGALLFAFEPFTNAGDLKTSLVLQAFCPTGGGGTQNATITTAPLVATGSATASAVSATTPAINPGPGKEVANTTDLSGVIIRVMFIGR